MKKNWLLVFVLVALFGFSDRLVSADTTLYRLYNPGLKVHLYTKDTNEYKVLGTRGWTREGTAWITADSGGDAVYRLYHAGLKVHLYTKDTNEYRVLATRGWTPEGVAFRSSGTLKIYRLYHEGLKKHLYTRDYNEYKVLGSRGWKQENVAFYGIDPNAQSPADKAKAALDQAKKDVAVAIANLSQAEQQLAQAKKADADRQAKIDAATTDVAVKTDAVDTSKAVLTKAQNDVASTTDKLTQTTDTVTKAQDALKNVDTVTINVDSNFKSDLNNWKTDPSEDNADFLKDSGFNSISTSTLKVGADDAKSVVDVNNLTKTNQLDMSFIYVDAVNQLRKQLGLQTVATVTDNAITIAQNRAKQYEQRGTDPVTTGHIPGAVENLVRLGSVDNLKTIEDIKNTAFQAFLATSFDDSKSNWNHLTPNMYANGGIGLSIANINGQYWLVAVLANDGTAITNPNDPTVLQAALTKAQADQAQAKAASDAAKAQLTQASSDYAAALDAKTQAEKVLADATATPLQTQVAENNLRLAKIALQNAQARQADAQKAVDNFKAGLVKK